MCWGSMVNCIEVGWPKGTIFSGDQEQGVNTLLDGGELAASHGLKISHRPLCYGPSRY